jgi:DNA-binding transcriptional ArsR family regulator
MARSSEQTFADLANLFGLLSDPIRLRIVLLLAKGESNVNGICEKFKLRQPTVSHHLGLLRMNRLIVGKRKGKQVIYSLEAHMKASAGKLKVSLPPFSVTLDGY